MNDFPDRRLTVWDILRDKRLEDGRKRRPHLIALGLKMEKEELLRKKGHLDA